MKAAIYIRVSTEYQSTDMQLRELEKYCKYHNLDYDIFEDNGTGTNMDREKLKEMLDAIDNGIYGKCIVWKLDRFSRSIADLVGLLGRLHKADCAFVSLREHIDFSTAVGRMQVQLLGVFAEFESAMTRERVTAGLQAAKARGKILGHAPRPFPKSKYKELKKQKMTMTQIAKELGFSRSQLFKRLANIA